MSEQNHSRDNIAVGLTIRQQLRIILYLGKQRQRYWTYIKNDKLQYLQNLQV